MLKNIFLVFILVVSIKMGFSQEIAKGKYWVQFADKDKSSYTVFKPNEFLTERAIIRRQRYNIPIDERDLPVNDTYINALKNAGGKVLYTSRWFNAVVVEFLNESLIDSIVQLPFVKSVDIKMNEYRANTTKPLVYDLDDYVTNKFNIWDNKVIKLRKTGVVSNKLDYGKALNQIDMLSGCDLHNLGFAGEGIDIAVIDAGFYNVNKLPSFKTLREEGRIKGVRDFVDGDTTVYNESYHGMNVLSTIGGNWTGKLIGTAPDASFWLLRSEDARSENIIEEANWVAAAEYADSLGVDVITTSLGYKSFDIKSQNYTINDLNGRCGRMSIASNIAASRGIVVVTSAGNAGFQEWQLITVPGDADSVITVGAVNRYREYSYFSSKGPTADNRVKPNVVARGGSSVVQDPEGEVSYSSGTSFSGPILAGMASCLLQAHRELPPMAILSAINACAENYSSPDKYTGHGLPDFTKALLFPKVVDKRRNIGLAGTSIGALTENGLFLKRSQEAREYSLPFSVVIKVYDTCGKLQASYTGKPLYNTDTGLVFPALSDLNKGVYFLKIWMEDISYSALVLK